MYCDICKITYKNNEKYCKVCGNLLIDPLTEYGIRLRNGDDEAFEAIYNDTKGWVLGKLRSNFKQKYNAEDVNDCLQEIYAKLYRNRKKYDPDSGSFRAWFNTLVHNEMIDYIRRVTPNYNREQQMGEEDFEFIDDGQTPEEVVEEQELNALLQEVLSDLSEEQKSCIILQYVDGLKQREIADKLGIPVGTVKSRINIGMKRAEMKATEMKKSDVHLYGLAPLPFFLWLLRTTDASFDSNAAWKNIKNTTYSSDFSRNTTTESKQYSSNHTSYIKSGISKIVRHPRIIGGIAGTVIVVTGATSYLAQRPETIDLNDYFLYSIEGYDGSGTFIPDLDTERLEDDIINAANNKNIDISEEKLDSMITIKVSESDNLTNGSKVTVSYMIDDNSLRDYGVVLKGRKEKIEVTDLPNEPEETVKSGYIKDISELSVAEMESIAESIIRYVNGEEAFTGVFRPYVYPTSVNAMMGSEPLQVEYFQTGGFTLINDMLFYVDRDDSAAKGITNCLLFRYEGNMENYNPPGNIDQTYKGNTIHGYGSIRITNIARLNDGTLSYDTSYMGYGLRSNFYANFDDLVAEDEEYYNNELYYTDIQVCALDGNTSYEFIKEGAEK